MKHEVITRVHLEINNPSVVNIGWVNCSKEDWIGENGF
jgi:hypothetical protein